MTPLKVKNLPKIGKRENNRGKEWKIRGGKWGRKGKNREGSFTLPLSTERADYASDYLVIRDIPNPAVCTILVVSDINIFLQDTLDSQVHLILESICAHIWKDVMAWVHNDDKIAMMPFTNLKANRCLVYLHISWYLKLSVLFVVQLEFYTSVGRMCIIWAELFHFCFYCKCLASLSSNCFENL